MTETAAIDFQPKYPLPRSDLIPVKTRVKNGNCYQRCGLKFTAEPRIDQRHSTLLALPTDALKHYVFGVVCAVRTIDDAISGLAIVTSIRSQLPARSGLPRTKRIGTHGFGFNDADGYGFL